MTMTISAARNLVLCLLAALCLGGCAVIAVAGAVVTVAATAVSVTATVVETTVDVAAAGVDAVGEGEEEQAEDRAATLCTQVASRTVSFAPAGAHT